MPSVYSVADLHGRLDLFEAALRTLPDAHLLILGDVIDRGPHGLALVRRLLELHEAGTVTLLRGNHEAMAESGLRHYRRYQQTRDLNAYKVAMARFSWWMENGGNALRKEAGFFSVETFPPELVEYLSRLLPLAFVNEDGRVSAEPSGECVLAVHATPPKEHPDFPDPFTAALWLRPHQGPFALPEGVRWSVHGHTPLRVAARLGDQVYTDLGAVTTGRLCLVRLDAPDPSDVIVVQGRGDAKMASRLASLGVALTARTIDVG
ncbi:metallophosphoesterase [Deinococcus yavapaiensis]|uniref:Serine/threonine protein phosphatase 1 n=1 Tax=Deinococcus yavapaiensis KR-236 TaxID=694435 RepID=A0A318SBD9_9DEIO|nr:metallophosphoesterase [Deinococcus yavapaiensis]PYE55892.1 serine/threonine protein phosphatase 1 [Deinococcus yavapaiensis KR-236]